MAAPSGHARIEWADGQMPVLRSIRERFGRERPLDGVSVGACLHVTAETANLVRALVAGGARVALAAANPLATQDDVADALRAEGGVEVHAAHGEGPGEYAENIAAVVATRPQIALDDGADLITAVHSEDPAAAEALLGATEETTTGLVRLRSFAAEQRLACPVIALNEATTERAFNDRFGSGQSVLDGILRATNLLLAGQTVVVLGYGYTGRGVALRARGNGAEVIVCEIDPLRALEARMEGFEVMPALAAAERGDVFVTATGVRDVLRAEHFAVMKDGAVLANAGHFDVEISLPELRAAAAGDPQPVLPLVDRYELRSTGGQAARRLNLLARGRVVNLAAGEGHPAAVMDVSFALHALVVELLATAQRLEPGVHAVPAEIDRQVARLKLAALGVQIDELSEEQERYLRSWSKE